MRPGSVPKRSSTNVPWDRGASSTAVTPRPGRLPRTGPGPGRGRRHRAPRGAEEGGRGVPSGSGRPPGPCRGGDHGGDGGGHGEAARRDRPRADRGEAAGVVRPVVGGGGQARRGAGHSARGVVPGRRPAHRGRQGQHQPDHLARLVRAGRRTVGVHVTVLVPAEPGGPRRRRHHSRHEERQQPGEGVRRSSARGPGVPPPAATGQSASARIRLSARAVCGRAGCPGGGTRTSRPGARLHS